MQFDIGIMDLLWIFNVIRYVTYDIHHGLRAKLDITLSVSLFLESLAIAFTHNIFLLIPLFLILIVLTAWCIAYVVYDQMKILDRTMK
ncbi:MAG: hypothetical protein AJITA_00938 [Acetilactobacillus jinshanensis]